MAERDYLREVERAFVARRGGTPFLAPADWEVARRWEKRGIPLAAALAGIARTRLEPRSGLRACEAAVRAAHQKTPDQPFQKDRPEWTPPAELPDPQRLRDNARTREELLDACLAALPAERCDALAAEAAAAIEGYRSRMPPDAFERLRRDSFRRHAARWLRLPS